MDQVSGYESGNRKKARASPGNELDEIRGCFAPTEKPWLPEVPQVILGRSTRSREAKKTRPTKRTQFLGPAEAVRQIGLDLREESAAHGEML